LPHAVEQGLAAELAVLRRHGLQVRVVAPNDRRALRGALADAVLLWCAPGQVRVAADLLREAPRLRLVQALSSGAEAIDLAAAKARGMAVFAAPGTDTAARAEIALALTFACLRRLPALDRASRIRLWPAEGELGGRTVGLVGYGPVPGWSTRRRWWTRSRASISAPRGWTSGRRSRCCRATTPCLASPMSC
jgi:phosphoglycerate dehydrogenase-like enzyme